MAAPVRFLSGRQQQQKIGIEGSTQNEKVLEVVGRAGIGTTIFEPGVELEVRGNQIVTGILTVGNITIGSGGGSTFEVENLDVSGLSTFTGAADFNSDVDIDGHTELDDVNISGILTATTLNVTGGGGSGSQANLTNLSVSGVSTFTGAIDANGSLDVDGHTELDNLNVSGVSTFVGVATFSTNDVYVAQRLFVGGVEVGGDTNTFAGINTFTDTTDNTLGNSNTGAVQIDGGLGVDKNVTIGAGLSVAGNAGIGSLNVVGVSTFGGLVTVTTGDVYIAQRLFVGGLEVEGTGSENTFTGINTFTNQTDNVLGDTNTGSLQGNGGLGIDKNASFGSTVFVQNAIGINSTAPIGQFDVNGHTELDDVNVSGAITATTFTGNLAGTVNTAAQPNITSLGTLSSLVVSGITSSSAFADFDYLQAPFGSTVTFTVTVASKDATHRYNGTGSGSGYLINGVQAPFLTLTPGRTYRFTNDNTGSHPFKFYLEADKTTEYTSGVSFQNTYTEITVSDETPTVLHYQCTAHGYMGNAIQTNSNVVNTNYDAILRGGLDVDGHTELDNVNVSGVSTFQSHVHLGDDDELRFGADVDFKIYHDPDDARIENSNGDIKFKNTGSYFFFDEDGGETLASFINDGAVNLYYDNSKKFETSGIGVTVTGQLDSTTLNVSGASTFTGAIDANGGADISGGSGLNVTGHTELDNVNVSGILSATSIDLTGSGGGGAGQANLTNLSVSGVSTFTGAIDANGGMDVSGGETTLSSATVSDLNAGRVVLAGTGGSLEDSSKLTFNASTGFLTVQGGASFNGNVSIGATLTYEDVTSVDSVGLVTARKGIRIDSDGLVVTSGVSTFADNIVGTISTATNLAGGDTGDIPYQSANGATTFVDATGVAAGLVLMWGGSNPIWSPVSGASGNFGGITLLEEGSTVGTAGSVTGLNFVGNNVTATASSGITNGVVTLSDTPTFDSLKVTGISTIPNVSGVTTFSDNVHVGTGITMYASSGIISATAFYGSGENLTDLLNQKIEGLQLRKDGVIVGSGYTFSTLDFTGDGVSVTGVGTTGQISIPGFGPDGQENLYVGTGAGAASDADTCFNIAFGCDAGNDLNSGDYNVFLGYKAGAKVTSGGANVFIGQETGSNGGSAAGSNNIAMGCRSGCKLTGGLGNLLLGCGAGKDLTNEVYNVFLGYDAGQSAGGSESVLIGRAAGAANNNQYAIFIGNAAGRCQNAGQKNIAMGCCALFGSSTYSDNDGCCNIALGVSAGKCIGNGSDNVFLGTYSGKSITTGSSNILLGNFAGCSITDCNSNLFIGNEAGRCSDGGYNLYFGYRAGKGSATVSSNTGGHNIAMAMDAGCSITSGTRNVFLGLNAGLKNTEGSCNVFLGDEAGCLTTTGDDNVYIGQEAGKTGTTAHTNIAIGKMAARDATGCYNTVLGSCAGRDLTGIANVVIGQQTGIFATSGCYNVFLGAYSAQCVSGNDNVILGSAAGRYATTGCYNVFFGKCTASGAASNNVTGNHNIAMGCESGQCLTSGTDNIFLGQRAGKKITDGGNNIAVGQNSGCALTEGCNNIFLGQSTGKSATTGIDNIIIGRNAASCATITGNCNVAIGPFAMRCLSNGFWNVAIGRYAGSNLDNGQMNTFLGACAGNTNTSGCCNVAIGFNVELPSATGNNQLAIGNGSDHWITGDSSFNVTVSTASTFSNDGLNVTGVVTATSFEGDGSNLTGIAADKISEGNTEVEVIDTGSDGHVKFTTEGSERARIDSSGRMGIGVTNPVAKLEVNVGSAVTALDIQGSAGQLFSVTNNLTSGSIFSVNDVSGIPSIDVDADGTIQLAPFSTTEFVGVGTTNPTTKLHVVGEVTATDFNSTSDARLKTNVQVIDDPLERVLQINGVSFNWVENNKPSMGVIADNIEEVLPELVSDTNPKTVNYNGLIGLLIEVVKDQQTQINSLNERLSQLE